MCSTWVRQTRCAANSCQLSRFLCRVPRCRHAWLLCLQAAFLSELLSRDMESDIPRFKRVVKVCRAVWTCLPDRKASRATWTETLLLRSS
jgi:hypothetical protein